MKKMLALFFAVSLFAVSFASMGIQEHPKKAIDILLPIGKSGQKISLLKLSQVNVKEYETITGQKLKLAERILFKLEQRKLKECINADSTINNKKLDKATRKNDGTRKFHLGGFALGFIAGLIGIVLAFHGIALGAFFGLVGVLIAYLIKDKMKPRRVKWAWIGFGIMFGALLLMAILITIALSAANF